MREPGGAPHDRGAAGRVVQDEDQRARSVARHSADRQRGTGSREHQENDQQRPSRKKQQVLQLEPALVLLGRRDEVTDGGEDDGRGLAPGQQMKQDGDRGADQADQCPRVEETDHREPGSAASASRNTRPYGVSVVTRWYPMPWRLHASRHSPMTPRTVC
jgi:hypothetical protein